VKAGWETATLGDVCELIARGVAPKYVEDGGILVLNQKCVRGHVVSTEFARRHDDSLRAVRPDRLIAVGDVLVNSTGTGTLGRVAQVRAAPAQPMTVDTHVTIVRPKSGKFYLDFFGYLMIVIEDQLAASGEGTSGQTELSRSALADKFMVSYPTCLDEQRRIVAVLDQAFAAIATATANAQKNQSNARALFESYLESIATGQGKGWAATPLGDVCKTQYGISGTMNTSGVGYKIFRMGEVQDGRMVDTGQMKHIDIPDAEFDAYRLSKGDVLFNRTNSIALVGKTGVFSLDGPYCFASYLIRVIFNPKQMSSRFAGYVMNSQSFLDRVRAKAAQSVNQANINATILRAEVISYPTDVTIQDGIVEKLNALSGYVQSLQSVYQNQLTALAELKQSLLQKAFAGELTAAVAQTPAANDNFATAQGTAQILAFAHRRHEQKQKQRTFGHVKAQKSLHLVESIGGIDLGRQPIKDAAGPNDMQHMLRATDWAVQRGFFEFVPRSGGKGYDFKKLANYDACWAEAEAVIKPVATELTRAIDLIVDSPSDFAELIATTHAAWNNLIIDNATITDDAVVLAARDNWHVSKLRFDPSRFHDAIRFIRTNGIIPDGSAKYVGGQGSLL
jgi:type I restriction enzyme, S subunit